MQRLIKFRAWDADSKIMLYEGMQPSGQRPQDLVKFAKEILNAYPEI